MSELPPADRLPRHVAVIMDGNGRWAVRQGLPRVAGHRQGVATVKRVVTECSRICADAARPTHLTLYSFSLENWRRPASEVGALMEMYVEFLQAERPTMHANRVRFRQIGRLDNLPEPVLDEVRQTVEETARYDDGLTLTLALNYGARAELADAAQAIARKVERGALRAADVDEATVAAHLYDPSLPDVDLLVRTAGELRVSNYLLWQISYAEIAVSDRLWPEFDVPDLHACLRAYAARNRRFGALDATNS